MFDVIKFVSDYTVMPLVGVWEMLFLAGICAMVAALAGMQLVWPLLVHGWRFVDDSEDRRDPAPDADTTITVLFFLFAAPTLLPVLVAVAVWVVPPAAVALGAVVGARYLRRVGKTVGKLQRAAHDHTEDGSVKSVDTGPSVTPNRTPDVPWYGQQDRDAA